MICLSLAPSALARSNAAAWPGVSGFGAFTEDEWAGAVSEAGRAGPTREGEGTDATATAAGDAAVGERTWLAGGKAGCATAAAAAAAGGVAAAVEEAKAAGGDLFSRLNGLGGRVGWEGWLVVAAGAEPAAVAAAC